jgi:predicted kinase
MTCLVCVLVGPVGSGKSTLCANVKRSGNARWLRINQDELKRRKKCESTYLYALQNATHNGIFIDRQNFNAEQRSHWIRIAMPYDVECWALWLDLPAETVARRARERVSHEGGVVGSEAERLSAQFARDIQRDGGPKLDEGFSDVIRISNDHEVELVTAALAAFGKEFSSPGDVMAYLKTELPRTAFISATS